MQEIETRTPTRQPRPKRENVRERLIVTAIRLFERDGYAAASLAAVAEEAGFSRGAVYSNFGSKEDLFLAALEENAILRIDAIIAQFDALPIGTSHRSAQPDLGESRTWALLFIEFCLQAHRDPALQERLTITRRRMRQEVSRKLEPRLAASGKAAFVEHYAAAAMALNNGLIIEQLCDGDALNLDTINAAYDLASCRG